MTRILRVIARNVDFRAEDVVVRANVTARNFGRRLIERNRGLRIRKQTENRLLINLVERRCVRIEHLGFSCCRRNLCGALVKEVRTDRTVVHKLVPAIGEFNCNSLRVSALGSVAVRIKIRIQPDTHDRFHIDRIRIVLCLQFEGVGVIAAVQRRSVVGFQLNLTRCEVCLRHILIRDHENSIVIATGLAGTRSGRHKVCDNSRRNRPRIQARRVIVVLQPCSRYQ